MIKAIRVNYEATGVLGEREGRSDVRNYGITTRWVDKAIEFVVRSEDFTAVHFMHDDGSNDCIWQEHADNDTRTITWRHDQSDTSRDEPMRVTTAEFKRYIKQHVR